MITFLTKNIETMTYCIHFSPLVNCVMDSIEFTSLFFIKYFFNYMIKIYGNKIEHQPKNKNLFETIITHKKKKKIMLFILQPIQY
jgi:hypothetical protein